MDTVQNTLTGPEKEALAKLAAPRSFWAFCAYWDFDFFVKRRPFLKRPADALQEAYECYQVGEALRVAISMPPRAGKSYLLTLFCAWWIGGRPLTAVMRCTGTAQLYTKFSRECREIIDSPRFRAIFPYVRIDRRNRGVKAWGLAGAKQAAYFGNGVGGSIIGFGGNIGIVDDLYPDMSKALSTSYVARVNAWFDSAFSSRLERGAPLIYVGTRWSEEDAIGRAITQGLDNYIAIPALDAKGETFCKDVKTSAEYRKIREGLRLTPTRDGAVWLAEYMQRPARLEGYLFPGEELHYYDELPDREPMERLCFVDPADEGEDGFTASFLKVYAVDGLLSVYITDVVSAAGEGVEAGSTRVADLCRRNRTELCYVEANGIGKAAYIVLRNELRDSGRCRVRGYIERTPKEVRILTNYERIRRYFHFPANYADTAEFGRYMEHLTRTPSRHIAEYKHKKDPADNLSQAATYLRGRYQDFMM